MAALISYDRCLKTKPINYAVTISNGSGTKRTEITSSAASSAYAWAGEWAKGLRLAGEGMWLVTDVHAVVPA